MAFSQSDSSDHSKESWNIPTQKPSMLMGGSSSIERFWHLAAVNWDGCHLAVVPEQYRADREIVLAAVQRNGYALQSAAEECRADREVVLAAVQQYGLALKYAAEERKADHEIVMAAVRQDFSALRFAAEECKAARSCWWQCDRTALR
eukprot:3858820-Amphidinium_carterae.1